METLNFPLTDEQIEALDADRLLPDLFLNEDTVRNLGRGIRQMVAQCAASGKCEHLITYMPDIVDFMYVIGRIEQDLREKRYKEGDITIDDLNETLHDH